MGIGIFFVGMTHPGGDLVLSWTGESLRLLGPPRLRMVLRRWRGPGAHPYQCILDRAGAMLQAGESLEVVGKTLVTPLSDVVREIRWLIDFSVSDDLSGEDGDEQTAHAVSGEDLEDGDEFSETDGDDVTITESGEGDDGEIDSVEQTVPVGGAWEEPERAPKPEDEAKTPAQPSAERAPIVAGRPQDPCELWGPLLEVGDPLLGSCEVLEEGGESEVDDVEIDSLEAGSAVVIGVVKENAVHLGPVEGGAPDAGFGEPGVIEVGPFEGSALEVGPKEVDGREVGVLEGLAGDVDPPDILVPVMATDKTFQGASIESGFDPSISNALASGRIPTSDDFCPVHGGKGLLAGAFDQVFSGGDELASRVFSHDTPPLNSHGKNNPPTDGDQQRSSNGRGHDISRTISRTQESAA